MSRRKKIAFIAIAVIILIQFIQPAHNTSKEILPADISKTVAIPENVKTVLQVACYDCHSNNTRYPWYTYVQPIGWFMNDHIQKGKKQLNFSEFGTYSARRQLNKLKSIANQVKDDAMPLSSYTWMHKNARLTKESETLIINWVQQKIDSVTQKN